MTATSTLVLSKHVHFGDYIDGGQVVHNKLFGNLCVLDHKGAEFLRTFGGSESRSDFDFGGMEPQVEDFVEALKDRFFLVSEGFDERDLIAEEKQFRMENAESGYLLKGIQLVLTNECNLGCHYCYQDTVEPAHVISGAPSMLPVISLDPQPMRKKAPRGNMSPETAVRVVRSSCNAVRAAGNRSLSVEFFGGEPLLNWETISAVLDEVGTEYNGVRLFYSVTTNATRITDPIAEKLVRNRVTVTVSFDSPVNSARLTKAGGSADGLIAKGLAILAAHRAILTFNTVVSTSNVDQIDVVGLLEVAKAHRVQQIGVILDLDALPYQDRPAMARVMDTVMEICERAPSYGISITGYWHQVFEQMVGTMPINLEKGYKTCAAEGCKLSFEPDGSIMTCKIAENPLGETGEIANVFKTDLYRRHVKKAFDTSPYCRGCAIEGFCSGICVGTIVKDTGDIDGIVLAACDVYRELTKRLIGSAPSASLDRLTFPG